MNFRILTKDPTSKARTGIIDTPHGHIQTPAFLPIGTKATVKSIRNDELKDWGAEIILANTYHLWIQPGDELIARSGGLHKFMHWDKPIFTDSGGFQIFSLGEKLSKKTDFENDAPVPFNVKIKEEGVFFQSGASGNSMELTPEKSVHIQNNLGSDISVVLDEFTGDLDNYEKVSQTVERTTRWATRAREEFKKLKSTNSLLNPGQIQLGIVQGANFEDLRQKSAQEIRAINFEAYCIGGVAVGGETQEKMIEAVDASIPHLEENKFRHLLGVGTPENIIQAVAHGCDTFDCVIPTREARHGRAYVDIVGGYTTMNILASENKENFGPLDAKCSCYGCQNHSLSYIHHLFKSREILGIRLITEHNLRFYIDFMSKIRASIDNSTFENLKQDFKINN